MPKRLNALEVLYLHYINGKNEEKVNNYSFWFHQYSTNPFNLFTSLKKRNVIKESTDLKSILNNLKVTELKDTLRQNNLKLSGNKPDLIKRIIENNKIINFDTSAYPSIYFVTDEYKSLLNSTEFITYFHNNHIIDIFDAYDYSLKHRDKSNGELIVLILNDVLKEELKKEEYFNVSILYNNLARYYYDHNDEYSAQYHLHNYQMLNVLNEIERIKDYNSYGISISIDDDSYMFFINDWSLLQYKSLLKTRQIDTSDLKNELIDSTKHLPFTSKDKEAAAIYIIERVSDNHDASKNLLNKIMKSYSKTNTRQSKTRHSENKDRVTELSVTYNLDHKGETSKQQLENTKSGCLLFFSIPTVLIVYALTQLTNII